MSDEIYIELLDEGSPTSRPTRCVENGNGTFLVLPTEDYDPEDEKWEFPPGSLVVGEKKRLSCGEVFVAKRLAGQDQVGNSSNFLRLLAF